jgi:hypothetical protein
MLSMRSKVVDFEMDEARPDVVICISPSYLEDVELLSAFVVTRLAYQTPETSISDS